jgi:hypothetical protein
VNFGPWRASKGSPAKEAEMPRKGRSEEQIVFELKQVETED